MKKVLILSYFFPPCNLTAAQRPASWAKYLTDFGYYPIVITRKWEKNIEEMTDIAFGTSSGNEIINNENNEVHYLPYKPNLRDRIIIKYGATKFVLFRKVLSFLEVFLQNFFISALPYANIYNYADEYLKRNKDVTQVIVTANPFQLFFFGYKLKKKHPHIQWIADYRDEWTTNHLYRSFQGKNSLISSLERKSEIRWLANASIVTTVCAYFANRIADNLAKETLILPNGFSEMNIETNTPDANLSIVFGGTLYENQPIDILSQSLNKIEDDSVVLLFLGSALENPTEARIKRAFAQWKGKLKISKRLGRNEANVLLAQADIFVMFPFVGMKGWPSSKLYDYLPYQKPVLLCPSDNDIIEDILTDTGLGLIANSVEECVALLEECQRKKQAGLPLIENIKTENIKKYSRYEQCRKLAEILDSL